MIVVIDTSSLIALVRYYQPFDKDDSLKNAIKSKVESGEIIILDVIVNESKYTAKGIVLETLDFLADRRFQIKTGELLPDLRFFNLLENQFCIQSRKRQLNEAEYEQRKETYLASADVKLLLYCLQEQKKLDIDKLILVTEETAAENDSKLFKKLPAICDILKIDCCNLPNLFKDHLKINLSDYLI